MSLSWIFWTTLEWLRLFLCLSKWLWLSNSRLHKSQYGVFFLFATAFRWLRLCIWSYQVDGPLQLTWQILQKRRCRGTYFFFSSFFLTLSLRILDLFLFRRCALGLGGVVGSLGIRYSDAAVIGNGVAGSGTISSTSSTVTETVLFCLTAVADALYGTNAFFKSVTIPSQRVGTK